MPNWVTNSLGNWDKDLYNKYSNLEDKEDPLYIDFNKVIPEPEEIAHTISSSINDEAKQVTAYKEWKENGENTYKYNSPLYSPLRDQANNIATTIGYKAIENPDKSLNEMIVEKDNSYMASRYEHYVSLFGNTEFNKLSNEQFIESCENYCDLANESFMRSKESDFHKDALGSYDSIEDYGRHLNELKEKYGVDNWYDWRNMNWGTKWNGCYQDYDPESENLHFDTAWSVPEPILAKIAQDNPDKKIDVYSEEETGWFVESELKDGKYVVNATGDIEWDDEGQQSSTTREEYNPPKTMEFKDIVDNNKAFIERTKTVINKL
jgi:hypothetical protein